MRCLFLCIVFGAGMLGLSAALHAQVMQSTNYQIEFDSINIAGGRATSSSYVLEDTVGEQATGRSQSASYQLRAGYQQMNETELSLSAAADVALTPALGGVSGGTSNGSTAVTATTDNLAGYELSIKASSSPAMQGDTTGATIADYTPDGANPDFLFSVAADDAEMGFTPEGTDIAQRYQDNGASCNAGSSDAADRCWDALSTGEKVVARRTTSNHPAGTETSLKFRVEIGASANQVADTYTATSTLTLIAL